MKRIWIVLLILIFFIPAMSIAECLKIAESDISPPTIQRVDRDTDYYNYNIQEVQEDRNGDGQMETFYRYCYVEISGAMSKRKVIDAIEKNESVVNESELDQIEQERSNAMSNMQTISDMTYSQVDTYVENNFGNLSQSQKTALKKLYKAVLAIIKRMSWD